MAKTKWNHGWGWRLSAGAALAMAAWLWLGERALPCRGGPQPTRGGSRRGGGEQ